MGLPGSGKTTLAKELKKQLQAKGKTVMWFNADSVRADFQDWDFTEKGRIRQATRMNNLASKSTCDFVICDFVAPLVEMRKKFDADVTVWVDTIQEGRFSDTNQIFVAPDTYEFRVTEQNCEKWAPLIVEFLLNKKAEPKDTIVRSFVKAYSYRICGSLTTVTISFFVTGDLGISAAIGFTEMILKPMIYWAHERVWNRIRWGKNG